MPNISTRNNFFTTKPYIVKIVKGQGIIIWVNLEFQIVAEYQPQDKYIRAGSSNPSFQPSVFGYHQVLPVESIVMEALVASRIALVCHRAHSFRGLFHQPQLKLACHHMSICTKE